MVNPRGGPIFGWGLRDAPATRPPSLGPATSPALPGGRPPSPRLGWERSKKAPGACAPRASVRGDPEAGRAPPGWWVYFLDLAALARFATCCSMIALMSSLDNFVPSSKVAAWDNSSNLAALAFAPSPAVRCPGLYPSASF